MKPTQLLLIAVLALPLTSLCAAQADQSGAKAPGDHPLGFMFGEWAGTATGTGRDGKPFRLTQTERVGPMLNGEVTVIEGRGYGMDGKLVFNAFAVVSRKKGTEKWEIRSYTRGYAGTYPFEPRDNGYQWTVPAGPGAVVRYSATFEGDTWHQIGERVPKDGEPRQIFEMTLKRIGDTDWPASGAVTPPGQEE